MSTVLTRRSAMFGAVTSTAAIAVAAVPAIAGQEHPWIKARRLAKELSDVLADCDEGATVAIVSPKGALHEVLFASRRWYEAQQTMTEEQAAAVAAWQLVTIEANAQWEVYRKSGVDRWPHRVDDGEYKKWQAIYERQCDARTKMTRAFYPKA